MKLLQYTLLTFSFLTIANCSSVAKLSSSSRELASDTNLKSCYQEEENRVYFMKKDSPKACKSRTFFNGPKGFLMNDNLPNEDGTTTTQEGSPQIITLKDGSTLFVSAWNNLSKADTVIVLKVDLKNNSVQMLCKEVNHSISFKVEEAENGKIKLLVKKPVSVDSNEFVLKKVDCQ